MMKQLWINGEPLLGSENNPLQVERIEFGDDEIVGYIGKSEVFALRGLNPENTYEVRDDEGNVVEPDLPISEHIGKLIAVNPALAKPATITRRFMGTNYDVACLVTQSIAELYQAGQIQIDDYVLVSFIEENPNTEEKLIAIVTDKVYESW